MWKTKKAEWDIRNTLSVFSMVFVDSLQNFLYPVMALRFFGVPLAELISLVHLPLRLFPLTIISFQPVIGKNMTLTNRGIVL